MQGEQRTTKHAEKIARPKLVAMCMGIAAGIDIHSDPRTEYLGLQKVWQTKNYIHWQLMGILDLILTYTSLAKACFDHCKNKNNNGVKGQHRSFKIKLATQLSKSEDHSAQVPRVFFLNWD